MKLFSQIAFIARTEARYFARFPKLFLAAAAVVVLPAFYSVIYLSSVWEPEAKTGALAVALVNLDEGVEYHEHVFNVGWEVVSKLKAGGRFGYRSYSDEQAARQEVRQGKLAFALIIPKGFSSNAIPGAQAGAGKLVVYTSEGNNLESAAIARHFAETLGHDVNESLNERRWALVLRNAVGSQRNVNTLREGVRQLQIGAKELSTGTAQTETASKTLSNGANRLKNGAETLATGHTELNQGMVELQSGALRLKNGVLAFQDEAKGSIFIAKSTTDNIDQLADGLTQLDKGLHTAKDAQHKLTDGAHHLSTGLGTLHSGTVVLVDATQKINTGSQRLKAGLDLLANSLPHEIPQPDGSAEGLANSVVPVMEVEAVVHNSGSGFAPNVLAAALWLGAGIAAFLIHVRVLPRHAQFFVRPAQLLGKVSMPALVVLLQSLLVWVTVLYFLRIQLVSPIAFALTLATVSITFLFIVFALTRAFGDAGKGMAMILLAVQLSSSGGILPIELSGGWFASISPWLPLTWVVRALKASMFGAYNGEWGTPLLLVALAGVVAAALSCFVGRWRFVKPNAQRPAIDF